MKYLAQRAAKALLSPLGLELRYTSLSQFPEATPADRGMVDTFARYSMTPPLRLWSLLKAIQYVERAGVPGDIVECGVWKGGNMMLAKAAMTTDRRVWLYDTFAGMSTPTAHDVSTDGRQATAIHTARQRETHNAWAYASLDEVRDYFRRHGLLDDSVIFREGRVEETLRQEPLPKQIAVLRLDTDWYESTLVELEVLYPRLGQGGVLILDDYGSWLGSKRAVDEYFCGNPPLLIPIDRASRMAVKVN